MQNWALELANVPDRVDHRSHQRQGIEQEPTVHMGPSATAMERRGEQVAAGEGRAYEIGRASWRERGGKYVLIAVGGGEVQKNKEYSLRSSDGCKRDHDN